MLSLDNQNFIQSVDRENLAKIISQSSQNGLKILSRARKSILIPKNWPKFGKVVVSGMGGSGIVGELAKMLISPSFPFLIVKNNKIGLSLDKNTLSIIVSFSGNTKETLSCFKESLKKKAHIFVISSGGEIIKIAKSKRIPYFQINHPGPPRTALINLLIPMLVLLEKLHLASLKGLSSSLKKLKELNQYFEPKVPTEKNISKHLAYTIFKHLPIITALSQEKALGWRWATQFQENSKNFAFTAELPEIFHNLVEAKFPELIEGDVFFIILGSKKHNHITKFAKFLSQRKICFTTIIGQGKTCLERIWYLILLGDWTSYYLAILNNTPPAPTNQISQLKHINKF